MTRLLFGYIIILVGIAGLVLPIIPGLIFLFIGLNMVSDDGGTKILDLLKERRPFKQIFAKIDA